MELKEKEHIKRFDIRSEKVRHLIGKMPSVLVRQGILIVSSVILSIFALSAYMPYKRVQTFTIQFVEQTVSGDSLYGVSEISIAQKKMFYKGQKVSLYDHYNKEYKGTVIQVLPINNSYNLFRVGMLIEDKDKLIDDESLKGVVTLVNTSVLQYALSSGKKILDF